MRISILSGFLAFLALGLFVAPHGFASDGVSVRQLELAKQMHSYRPAREQVDAAIERIARAYPAEQREAFKVSMRRVLNYRAIEKSSIEAMVEGYTEAEVEAMVAYYARPEARSASEKYVAYAAKVQPEIVKMIDQAMMKIKTGGN